MAHLPGHDRSQLLLLREAVDDYVCADNPVRFIEAFANGLDLAALGFNGTVPKVNGAISGSCRACALGCTREPRPPSSYL